MPSNTIFMTPGDTIDLTGIDYDSTGSANLVGNELQVTENGQTYDLHIVRHSSNEFFHLSADTGNGTDITENTTPCYLPRHAASACGVASNRSRRSRSATM